MDALVGQILENTYRIGQELGQGGMGAVFKGTDLTLNRDVAIKVMHPHIARQQGFRDRFLQEARAIANLDHPGIVQVYAFSRNPELLYIVMAFVPGQNLRDWLHMLSQQSLTISLPEGLALVEQVARALGYAHRRGVFHRDIKPGNIILRPLDAGAESEVGLPFQPVVTDFGLAKLAEGGLHSITGLSMGTPAYMAPEQCEGLNVDGRADLYALGIVLYELATGQVPFEVKTLTEAIRAHTQTAPAPPRSLVPDLPTLVEEIILKALAKQPDARFASAEDMARALRVARLALPEPEQATLAPTQAARRVSLVTMMGQATPEPTPQDLAWPTPPTEIPTGGQMVIMAPDGSTRIVSLGARQRLTIGRREDNDIVLNDNNASRQHAQITVQGDRYTITDLNSTNGTFLGTSRLLPGVAEVWRPAQSLRVGDHWLRLQLAPAARPEEPVVSQVKAAATPPPSEPIQVAVAAAALAVEAGKMTQLNLSVHNRQAQVDHFEASLEGVPEAWVTPPASALRLAPGDTGTITLAVRPPREAASRAGVHPLYISVTSRANPSHRAIAEASLTIAPFHGVNLGITPGVLTNSGLVQLRVRNQGNVGETLSLKGADAQEALLVAPAQTQFALGPGEERTIEVPVRPKARRPWMGTPQPQVFDISATTAEGLASTVSGNLTIKPFLPAWALPLLTTLVVLACVGGYLLYQSYQNRVKEEADRLAQAAAAQTATVDAQQALILTQTAQALAVAQTETAQAMSASDALTATATWLNTDSDGDGLTNAQEQQWGTNAANQDSDGDTLSDGQEVSQGSSPISKDTDGDGLQDNVDPDPGMLPTHTPTDTPLPTETWTPLPTETPLPTGTTQPTATPTSLPQPFAHNQLDGVVVKTTSVGKLTQVCLKQDNAGPSPDWYVEYIEVSDGSGYERFYVNKWLSSGTSLSYCASQPTPTPTKGLIVPVTRIMTIKTPMIAPIVRASLVIIMPVGTPQVVAYKVRIKTGNLADAGTSAQVALRLVGSSGDSGWQTLN